MDQSCLQIIDIEDDSEISLKDVHSNCEGSMASVYHCIETGKNSEYSTIIAKFEDMQHEWDDFKFKANDDFQSIKRELNNDIQSIKRELNDDIQNIKRELYKLTKSFNRVYGKKI